MPRLSPASDNNLCDFGKLIFLFQFHTLLKRNHNTPFLLGELRRLKLKAIKSWYMYVH